MRDTKRRDNKGRVLHSGESQDVTGRYCYRYRDPFGKRKAGIKVSHFMPILCLHFRNMKFYEEK